MLRQQRARADAPALVSEEENREPTMLFNLAGHRRAAAAPTPRAAMPIFRPSRLAPSAARSA